MGLEEKIISLVECYKNKGFTLDINEDIATIKCKLKNPENGIEIVNEIYKKNNGSFFGKFTNWLLGKNNSVKITNDINKYKIEYQVEYGSGTEGILRYAKPRAVIVEYNKNSGDLSVSVKGKDNNYGILYTTNEIAETLLPYAAESSVPTQEKITNQEETTSEA